MERLPLKKTKIVCTIGPASEPLEVLESMINKGMNIARINFAHGDYDGHERIIQNLRAAAASVGEQVTIMGDLPGPKIRIGRLVREPVKLVRGQPIILQSGDFPGDERRISVSFDRLQEVVNPGDNIAINDGFIQLSVEQVKGDEVYCVVQVGGELLSFKGVNLPGVDLGICAFTNRDRQFLAFAKEQGMDAISQSFCQDAIDIQSLREAAAEIDFNPFIIAKIERARAVENLDEILEVADGIMVARGDLGVEIPIEEIALVQKQIIQKSNIVGKPVITATHMLESMVEHNRPTRAEATDVANAILDGTDCVMLSGETAMGKFPVESVAVMTRIACVIEPYSSTRDTADILETAKQSGDIDTQDLISLSIFFSVEVINPVAVIVPTMSGSTARRVSRFRLPVWIISVSPNRSACKGLGFSYGVYPIYEAKRPESWSQYARDSLARFGISGELALLTKGTSSAMRMGTNEIEIIDLTSPGGREVIW